jgi:hypothetical protein
LVIVLSLFMIFAANKSSNQYQSANR